jgi:mycothione reductase
MKKFDLIVIGAGSGLSVSSTMASQGWKVAIVEPSAFGGTCLNRGCIPSKMLIHAADIVEQIKSAKKFGIKTKYEGIDFKSLVNRVSSTVDKEAEQILDGNKNNSNITVYQETAKFLESKVIQVGKEKITAEKIVIAAGGRPFVPPIPGLDEVEYLTSKEALRLKKLPKSMVVIGGGYISAELSHFFGTLGTKITILERGDAMLKREDVDVYTKFTEVFSKKHKLILGANASQVSKTKDGVSVQYEDVKTKKKKTVKAEQLLVVVGRKPNTDLLNLHQAGYRLNERGYLQTNEYLETSVSGVWALGDIAGNWPFKHSANYEAEVIVRNFFLKQKEKTNYHAMPHAVFTSPQIAGVGKTEQELKEAGVEYKVGKYEFKNSGMGMALLDEHSFVKVLADIGGNKILGCHILGHEASTLIHEVLPIMKNGGSVSDIANTIHVHPALSEVIQRAFGQI